MTAEPDRDVRIAVRPDLRLAVRTWDGSADPTFVLVHGLASNTRLWDGVAERLHAAGHAVVAYDQRGHGHSDRPDDGYGFATVVEDLWRLLDALDVTRPVLVGQSWGGTVVLEAGARADGRIAGVATVDGGTIDLQRSFPVWEACARAMAPPTYDGMGLADVEQAIRAAHPDWPEAGIAATLANVEQAPDGAVRNRLPRGAHEQILRALWELRPQDRYGLVDVPVLLIPAEGEQTASPPDAVEAARAELPRSRVRWLAGDHDLHAQQPDAVAGLLLGAVTDGFWG